MRELERMLLIVMFMMAACCLWAMVAGKEAAAKTNMATTIIIDESLYKGLTQKEAETMVQIAWCESRLDPEAQNKNSSAAGWFQITKATWESNSDYEWSERYDYLANLYTAIKIYQRRGVQPWQQCI